MSLVLLESIVRVSVVLLFALIALSALVPRSAALRHWVIAVAVVCAWAVAPMSALLPPWLGASLWDAAAPAERMGAPPEHVDSSAGVPAVRGSVDVEVTAAHTSGRSRRHATVQVGVGIWILGSLASAFVLLAGLARLRWLAARADVIERGRPHDIGEQVRRACGLASPVRILQSDRSDLLITWGWRRPNVLLPAAAHDWSDERLRIVLTHELAHIARRDWLVQIAAEALRALYWFNPLVWIACRRLRAESERACDDAVLSQGTDGPEYAAHLLAVARTLHPRRRSWLPAPAMARRSSLERRIRAMLDTTLNRRPVSRPARIVTIAALLAVTLSVAGLRAQPRFYSLGGGVFDPTNRVLPDVTLVLTNTTSGAKYEVRTDGAGRYEFVGLPPATYSLQATVRGFAPVTESVDVPGSAQVNLRLRLGSLQETVNVIAGSAPPGPPDAAAVKRQEEARQRFAEVERRGKAFCAGGGPATQVGGNILVPLKQRHVSPAYPEHLKAAGVAGTVKMAAVIGTDGAVRDVQVVESAHPDLDLAAADAVRQWQFTTTLLNCEPVEVNMNVTMNFRTQR